MPGGSGVAQWANGGKSTEPSPIPLLLYIVFWDTRTGSNRPVTRPVTRPWLCRHCPCIQNSWEQPSRYWGHSTRPGLASNADPSAFRPPAFARPIAQLPNCPIAQLPWQCPPPIYQCEPAMPPCESALPWQCPPLRQRLPFDFSLALPLAKPCLPRPDMPSTFGLHNLFSFALHFVLAFCENFDKLCITVSDKHCVVTTDKHCVTTVTTLVALPWQCPCITTHALCAFVRTPL